jgi:hypothetical protein
MHSPLIITFTYQEKNYEITSIYRGENQLQEAKLSKVTRGNPE